MDILENNIKDICNNYYNYLLSLENVKGIGYGFKYINNLNTFKPCLNILVKKKLSKNYIVTNNLIPKTYMGIMTDVIEVGEPKINQKISIPIKQKVRPLKGGISISATKYTGTLGCIVTRTYLTTLQEYFILSNAHILAYEDTTPFGVASPVFQPGKKFSTFDKNNIVARLATFNELKFTTIDNIEEIPENYMDCAIAKIYNKSLISKKIYKLGKIKGIGKIELNKEVQKVGAFSGLTKGNIKATHVSSFLGVNKTTTIFYKELILNSLKTKPGDSGSIIVDKNNKILGLFIGGTDQDAYMCDINVVLAYLNVSLYMG